MRLILVDRSAEARSQFHPVALSRPVWELRTGMTTLGEKLVRRTGPDDVACFVPDYLAEAYRATTDRPVNDPAALAGDDLLLVDARVRADSFDVPSSGPSRIALDADGRILYGRVTRSDAATLPADDVDAFLAAACDRLPTVRAAVLTYDYIWDLMLANPERLVADFAAAGRSGIEGIVEQPSAIRGSERDVYVAPGARIHPMAVIDAADGPVTIDEGAEVHPFTRIVGPCYIGPGTVLLGAKCHEGNSIGPACRIGGEVECSIIQGYTNKYHDGFLGHAYVGEWVNLGALTTNSDLKNDYSNVSVIMYGHRPTDTGSNKVGCFIGDHTKTSIGTFLNTGAYVGAMGVIMATGKPLQKFIPSFAWVLEGVVTKGFGRKALYRTAAQVMQRRGREWTKADRAMWDHVFEMTRPSRDELIKKGRRAMRKL
ncbi:MAG: putative sugar nucleotidyl transferase [Planctomycetota bacterium]|nr:putative sugar nucleotidyl transferase [Planctomycetota bacterium]